MVLFIFRNDIRELPKRLPKKLRKLDVYGTVATLLQAHPPGWAFECLGPNVQLELEPTRGGLIIQSER